MMSEVLLREDDRAVIKGIVTVMDMGAITIGHAGQLNPSLIKKVSTCGQVK
jgi:hypothetical protein